MYVICRKVHEERCVVVLLYEINGMCSYAVGKVLVLPERLAATFHVADAADTVHNRVVVSVARLEIV